MRFFKSIFPRKVNLDKFFSRFVSNSAVWLSGDVVSFAEKGYSGNVTVYSAIKQITTRCASIPWTLYNVKDQNQLKAFQRCERQSKFSDSTRKLKEEVFEEVTDTELNEVLKRPNPFQTFSQFVESVISHKHIAGNSFVLGVGVETGENVGKFLQLYPYRPDWVVVKAMPYPGPIIGYQLKGREVVPPEQIMHLRFFNPLDDRIGLSPVAAAIHPITQSIGYSEWNTSLVQNMGRPSGILYVKVDNLTPEQREKIKGDFRQMSAGSDRAGEPIITSNEVKYEELGITPKDMDWVNGLNATIRQIAGAFDVPPQLLGDTTTSTYSNVKEAIRYFYMGKIIPEMDSLRDELNNWLVPGFQTGNQKLFLDYNLEEIEVLQEERTAVHARALEALKAGAITLNSYLSETGRTELGDPGNIRMLPMGIEIVVGEEFIPDEPDEPIIPPVNPVLAAAEAARIAAEEEEDLKARNLRLFKETL